MRCEDGLLRRPVSARAASRASSAATRRCRAEGAAVGKPWSAAHDESIVSNTLNGTRSQERARYPPIWSAHDREFPGIVAAHAE
jgi:hypothetical protein